MKHPKTLRYSLAQDPHQYQQIRFHGHQWIPHIAYLLIRNIFSFTTPILTETMLEISRINSMPESIIATKVAMSICDSLRLHLRPKIKGSTQLSATTFAIVFPTT